MGQLAKQLAERSIGSFVANTKKNSKEECMAVLTRSQMRENVGRKKKVEGVLRENKQIIQGNELQEALNFLKLCILIFVDLLMLILSERKDTLSPLLMNIHVTVMSTYCMRNLR